MSSNGIRISVIDFDICLDNVIINDPYVYLWSNEILTELFYISHCF
jgi:hypothetical protein